MRKPKIVGFFDTKKVARLANLPLTEEEINRYTLQLTEVLNYIEQLNKVDTKDVKPTFNVSSQSNVTRGDTTSACLTQKEALSNAPNKKNGFIVTKGVFEE